MLAECDGEELWEEFFHYMKEWQNYCDGSIWVVVGIGGNLEGVWEIVFCFMIFNISIKNQ